MTKTITEVVNPYIKELTKARKALREQEEVLAQIESDYKDLLLALRKKVTATNLLKKQELSDK